MTRMVKCIKLGVEAEGLAYSVYPGELGKKIYDNVSKQAWASDGEPFLWFGCRRRSRLCADERIRSLASANIKNKYKKAL